MKVDTLIAPAAHSTTFVGQLKMLAPWAPSIVALLALAVAVIQYFRDQRRQRNLRIEERVAENLAILSQFSADHSAPLATPVAAFHTLQILIELSTVQATYREQITKVIAAAVREDLDFEITNHVRFDQLCLTEWMPYAASEATTPTDNMLIVKRYLAALKTAANLNPGLMRHIKITNEDEITGVPPATEYDQLRHLLHLVEAYSIRVSLLPANLQEQADKGFYQSTGNDNLTNYINQRRHGHRASPSELLAK
jgi:hypothetical protein